MIAKFTTRNYNYGDINLHPFPDYEPFGITDMLDKYSFATRLLYRYSRLEPRPFGLVMSRGCPFNCNFCRHRSDRRYQERSIPNVMAEIKEMYGLYQFNILIILDELFAVNKTRLKDFCAGILEGKAEYGWDFDWCFQTHANARLDLESLKMAKEAGCYFFSYGLESASPAVLRSMRKHLKPGQIIEAIDLAKEAKIAFGGNLIFGDPAETEKTICESLDFYFHYCQSEMVFMSPVVPYPGSEIFDYCIEKKIITDKAAYYETCHDTIYNMTQMSVDVLNHWLYVIQFIERSWYWVRLATEVSYEEEVYTDPVISYHQARMYKVTCKCPYCGEVLAFRQHYAKPEGSHLGTGCIKCGRRIRVNLGG